MKTLKPLTRRWLKRWADNYSAKANVQEPYWFVHNAGNECGTFCFKCGEKLRLELLEKFKDNPEVLANLAFLDGGYINENDGCEHCDTCDQLLSYTLTNYGAESEWDHFLEAGINLHSSEDAYRVQAILEHGMRLAGISKVKTTP